MLLVPNTGAIRPLLMASITTTARIIDDTGSFHNLIYEVQIRRAASSMLAIRG